MPATEFIFGTGHINGPAYIYAFANKSMHLLYIRNFYTAVAKLIIADIVRNCPQRLANQIDHCLRNAYAMLPHSFCMNLEGFYKNREVPAKMVLMDFYAAP